MAPFDVLHEKRSYGVAHSTVLINVTDSSFNLTSICRKAVCLYMFLSIFLWLTNAHLRSYSLMRHSTFSITLPTLFSLFHWDHLERNCCSSFLSLLQALQCTFRVYALCAFSWTLANLFALCCAWQLSVLQTLAQYCYSTWSSLACGYALVTLGRYEMHISQQCYQVLLQLSKSPNELRLFVIDFENITVNYFLSGCLKRYDWSRTFAIVYSLSQLLHLWSMCLWGRLSFSQQTEHQLISERFSDSNYNVWISGLCIY